MTVLVARAGGMIEVKKPKQGQLTMWAPAASATDVL
jgi:hypothetical protein